MIKSMTGFGKAVAETPQKKITIEVKSLNSKQLDINTKIPWLYKEKEPEIRNMISQKLDRGKIDVSINFDSLFSSRPIFTEQSNELRTLKPQHKPKNELNLSSIYESIRRKISR